MNVGAQFIAPSCSARLRIETSEMGAFPIRSGSKKNRSYMELNAQSFIDFDWFAVLDTTAYDREGWPYLEGESARSEQSRPRL